MRKKELVSGAPRLVSKKVAGIPIVSILGAYSFLLIAILLVISFLNPFIYGSLGVVTVSLILVSFFGGIAVYLVMKSYYARSGILFRLHTKSYPLSKCI